MNSNNIVNNIRSIIVILVNFLANVAIVIGMNIICEDFILGPWYNAPIIVLGVFIANIIFWPIFRKFLMKFMVMTFGIGALLINSVIFYCVSYYIPHVSVGLNGFLQVPLAMALATTIASKLLSIDYYENYSKSILNYVTKKRKAAYKKRHYGLIILEIDGLSKEVLEKAIEKGYMPTVKRWINEKTHTLKEWETDLSSQTGASQAGILHGNNEDIIAYRWVEKEDNNKIMVSGKLSHAPIIEKRISDGEGLLSRNGTSITNMFSGDGKNAILTSSKFRAYHNIYNTSLNSVFLDAYNFQRVFILFLWEIIIEIKSQIIHKLKNVQPRLRRNLIYATVRAGANVLLREIATETLTGDIYAGDIDIAYTSYVGYDEVAHHSGVEDEDVWNVLKNIDMQFNHLEKAEKESERPYKFVILSDHGQGNGATFKQRYGITLADYVRRLLPDDMKIYNEEHYNIDHFIDAFIPENRQIENIRQKVEDMRENDIFEYNEYLQNLKERGLDLIKLEEIRNRYANSLEYVTKYNSSPQSTKKAKDSELIVLGSGNLGLIYLTQWKKRLNYEEIVLLFPDLIPGLVNHSGIGFILVNSIVNGPMVIGSEGIYYLYTDKIEGKNPLADYGENAAIHLKRHNSFKHMPDILVNSFYDSKNNEICAFEELIGSHGGLGGNQTKPFILYPSNWQDPGELVGARSIYNFLKKYRDKLNSG